MVESPNTHLPGPGLNLTRIDIAFSHESILGVENRVAGSFSFHTHAGVLSYTLYPGTAEKQSWFRILRLPHTWLFGGTAASGFSLHFGPFQITIEIHEINLVIHGIYCRRALSSVRLRHDRSYRILTANRIFARLEGISSNQDFSCKCTRGLLAI